MRPYLSAVFLSFAVCLATLADNRVGLYTTTLNSEQETIDFIKKCKEHGIGTLYPSLSGGGTVIWKTDKADPYPGVQKLYDSGFDPLESFIRHAHAAGMKVYPSVVCGPGGKITAEHPEWETYDRTGKRSSESYSQAYIAFAIPEARKAKIDLLMDLVNGYEIDGIFLDELNNPCSSDTQEHKSGYWGYEQPLIDACVKEYGFDPRKVPLGSPQWMKFNLLQREATTTFAKELKDRIDASGKKVRIGGYADTDGENDAVAAARDWAAWGKRGYIDDLFLATYTEKGEALTTAVTRARQLVGDKVKIYPSLCPFNDFIKTEQEMIDAANALLKGKADGLWIYREDYLTKHDLWKTTPAINDLLTKVDAKP